MNTKPDQDWLLSSPNKILAALLALFIFFAGLISAPSIMAHVPVTAARQVSTTDEFIAAINEANSQPDVGFLIVIVNSLIFTELNGSGNSPLPIITSSNILVNTGKENEIVYRPPVGQSTGTVVAFIVAAEKK